MSDRRRVTGLDPKFTDILARMRGTTFEGERQAARNVGEAVAKRAGMTFDEAVAYSDDAGQSIDDLFRLWRTTQDDDERQAARRKIEIKAKRAGQTFKQAFDADQSKRWAAQKARGEPINPFVGLEDSMEADRPGYKAERARKAREEAEARAARRRAVLRRYGSEDAALAPCDRERKLLDAVKQWRVGRRPPYQRWTDNVDGWKDGWGKPPPHIDAAIRSAYPLPETFAAARVEYDYWRERSEDFEAALNRYGDNELDLVAVARMRIVESLIERELPVRTPADLLERFRLYHERGSIIGIMKSGFFTTLKAS